MARLNNENENLDEEVDFEFFDDKKSEISNSNNNALVKSGSLQSKSKDAKYPNAKAEKTRPKSKSSKSSSDSSSDDDNSLAGVKSVSSFTSSTSSKKSQAYSEDFSKSDSSICKKGKQSTQSSQSCKHDISNLQDSTFKNSDSDVTSVSSLESENLSEVIKPQKNAPKVSHNAYSRLSKYHTHLRSSDDMDMLSTDVILQAMMRIHEERRLVQKKKPDWVDPNTKDYSVSGITCKLNLVPERLVSMPKRNMHLNSIYFQNTDINKRLYHSAINRNRERDRIDKQNKEIVFRLQNIRPSPGITKDELLREYSKLNRFSSNPYNNKAYRSPHSSASSYAKSSANSSSGAKIRRTNSSTLVSRLADSRQSNSRHSDSKRVMSANSLSGPFSTRPSTSMNSAKKRH